MLPRWRDIKPASQACLFRYKTDWILSEVFHCFITSALSLVTPVFCKVSSCNKTPFSVYEGTQCPRTVETVNTTQCHNLVLFYPDFQFLLQFTQLSALVREKCGYTKAHEIGKETTHGSTTQCFALIHL